MNPSRHLPKDASARVDAPIEVREMRVAGQRLRVGIRRGVSEGPPLLIFNGIGANFELAAPLLAAFSGPEVVMFDVPGTGGSALPCTPYRLPMLAWLANRLLLRLGHKGEVDVLGVSWGGAPAQQFAFQYRRRCRRLVLAATSPGTLMVPGEISALLKMVNTRRYREPDFLARTGANLYGGDYRRQPHLLAAHARHIQPPRGVGYAYQMLAAWGWSSLPWLWTLRQPTLVLHGNDDPIVPLANGRILAALIPDARLHVLDDGHMFAVTRAAEVAAVMKAFLMAEPA